MDRAILGRRALAAAMLGAATLWSVGVDAAAAPPGLAITPGESVPDASEVPLSVEVQTSLNFDHLISEGGSGAVRLAPDGSSDVTGAVEMIGGRAVAGHVTIEGAPGRAITVDFPDTIELVGMNGSVLTIRRIVSDLPDNPSLDSTGRLDVTFGGEIILTGDADGNFRGNILVRANYL